MRETAVNKTGLGPDSPRLSAHVWELKDKGHTYTITWQILARASSYNPSSGMCRWSQAGLVDGSLPHAC